MGEAVDGRGSVRDRAPMSNVIRVTVDKDAMRQSFLRGKTHSIVMTVDDTVFEMTCRINHVTTVGDVGRPPVSLYPLRKKKRAKPKRARKKGRR